MALILRGLTLNEQDISQPLIGHFDERGGTLGRSDEATFTLPDPERTISRVQSQILHYDGHYWIENVSTVSPILHNGRPLGTGMRVMLDAGDELRIGGYVLQVDLEDNEGSATILRGRTVVPAPPARRAPPPPVGPRDSPALKVAADTNPQHPTAPAAESSGEHARPDGQGTLAEPLLSAARGIPASQRSEDADLDWQSFLEGAGLAGRFGGPASPELMLSIGQILKVAIEGIQELLMARAQIRSEMGSRVTLLQPRDNNPLKFTPDPVLALQMLLDPAPRGFLVGPAAVRNAVSDLHSHEAGMVAGLHAVLEAVLDRLNPAKLEQLPRKRSALGLLSGARSRSQLWDEYQQLYAELREDVQDNFQRAFGDAFLKGYEARGRSIRPRE
jgi:FHA domain-containing protein